MIAAAIRAIGDVLSPEFRGILLKAIGLTIALFVAVFVAVEALMRSLSLVKWAWADTLIDVIAGLGLLLAFFFLMAPVTALFAGLFLDKVAAIVEKKHYPQDPPGRELPLLTSIGTAVSFGLVVLLVNLAVLPTIFFGFGIFVILFANAYLLSREFFEMAAARHMPLDEARAFRKARSPEVLMAGFIPAALSAVPFISIIVPLFATAYFTHLFKRAQRSSA